MGDSDDERPGASDGDGTDDDNDNGDNDECWGFFKIDLLRWADFGSKVVFALYETSAPHGGDPQKLNCCVCSISWIALKETAAKRA